MPTSAARKISRCHQVLSSGFKTTEIRLMAYEQIVKILKRERFLTSTDLGGNLMKIRSQAVENVESEIISRDGMIN